MSYPRPNDNLPLSRIALAVCVLTAASPVSTRASEPSAAPRPTSDIAELSLEDLLSGSYVVTGSRREERATASLASISVLTREQIQMLPYFYLGDLLSMLPGVDARWGEMQRYYVGIRGFGSTTSLNSRLLLLWDGVPMNDPFTGELTAGHFVPLADIERLEVIRGPGSSMYGGSAFSGVVNVITRAQKEPTDGTSARVALLAGSLGTSRLQANLDQNSGPLRAGASVEALHSDGPFPAMERISQDDTIKFKNDDVSSLAASAHVGYKDFRLEGGYTLGDRGRPGSFITDGAGRIDSCARCHTEDRRGSGLKFPEAPGSCGHCHAEPRDREHAQRGRAAAFFRHSFGSIVLDASAYHNEYDTTYTTYRDAEFLNEFKRKIELRQRTSGAQLYATHSLLDAHFREISSALVGAEVRRDEAASELIETRSGADHAMLYSAAFYGEEKLTLWREWSATAGARADYHSKFGWAFTPRGGVVVTPLDRLALRLSASRAYRNPNLNAIFVHKREGRYAVTGNHELKPEWITSYEGGVSYGFQVTDALSVRVSGVGFYEQAQDLVAIMTKNVDEATFTNIHHANVAGAELELEAEIDAKPHVRVFANYSYQDARGQGDQRLPYAPRSKGNAGVFVTQDGWGLMARTRVVDRRRDESGLSVPWFMTVDASAQMRLAGGWFLQLWAVNLSGDEHQESLGIPAAPRSFFVSFGGGTEQ